MHFITATCRLYVADNDITHLLSLADSNKILKVLDAIIEPSVLNAGTVNHYLDNPETSIDNLKRSLGGIYLIVYRAGSGETGLYVGESGSIRTRLANHDQRLSPNAPTLNFLAKPGCQSKGFLLATVTPAKAKAQVLSMVAVDKQDQLNIDLGSELCAKKLRVLVETILIHAYGSCSLSPTLLATLAKDACAF